MINAAGQGLNQRQEGERLKAYLDAGGVATIGIGHTGPDVHLGLVWTREQSRAAWRADLEKAEAGLRRLVTVPLGENELAALVDFTFNAGVKNFAGSSMRRLLNRGDRAGAARALLLWDKARINGKLVALPDLQRRRHEEATLFLTPSPLAASPEPQLEPAAVDQAVAVPAGELVDVAVEDHSPRPEHSGVSTVERPPSGFSGPAAAAAALVPIAAGAKQAVEALQPVHDGLVGLGLSPAYVGAALAAIVIAAAVYFFVQHCRAHKAALA